MPAPDAPTATDVSLAASLEALASPLRLAILRKLVTPAGVSSLRILPDSGGDAKLLSRQAVGWHVDHLVDAGLVVEHSRDGRTRRLVADHQRLFAVVEEMANLAKLKPTDLGAVDAQRTLSRDAAPKRARLPGPRLVLVHGRDAGAAFTLSVPDGDARVLGRGEEADVVLDYDPFVSTRHARFRRVGDGVVVEDLGSSNGTLVNDVRLTAGVAQRLVPGDVVTTGRSRLVFQA